MCEDGQPGVATRRYERQCSACTRWFCAWDAERMDCYICRPLPKEELQRFKAAMESRNRSGDGNGHKPVATTVVRAVAPSNWRSGWGQRVQAIAGVGGTFAKPGAEVIHGALRTGSPVSR